MWFGRTLRACEAEKKLSPPKLFIVGCNRSTPPCHGGLAPCLFRGLFISLSSQSI